MDFSSGVVDHVKSFYNPSLWQTNLSNQNADATPKSPDTPAIVSDNVEDDSTKASKNNDNTDDALSNNNVDCDKKIDHQPENEPKMASTLLPAPAVDTDSM